MKLLWIVFIFLSYLIAKDIHLPGIYLGDDVSQENPKIIAVSISTEGIVKVWIGAKIPLLDKNGKEVFVKRVEIIK